MTSPFEIARAELEALGVVLTSVPGEYRVNFRKGRADTEYLTDDLQDALAHGRAMAAAPPAPSLPPLGPTGSRGTLRGTMYRHNRKLAAKRRRG